MRALMLHAENTAVGHYRIWTPAKYLRRKGWDIFRLPDSLPKMTVDQWDKEAEGADIVVISRADNPETLALMLAIREKHNVPIVMDVDDDVYDVSANSPAYKDWLPGSPHFELFELFASSVDAMTVSTPALAEAYKKLNPNIYVLPNYQDMEWWQGSKRYGKTNTITLGWAGGITHYDDLYMIRRPLKRILRKHPNVQFVMTGFEADFLKGNKQVTFIKHWAHVSKYPEVLARLAFDIGLAPVVDRPFNRGKSNIKWQEYSMLQIPTIASPVGEYLQIDDGETGLLAHGEKEWEAHMEKLIGDVSERKRLGVNAQRYVKANTNIALNIGEWETAYQKIIERHKWNKHQQIPKHNPK